MFQAPGGTIYHAFSARTLRTTFLFDVVCWDTSNDFGGGWPGIYAELNLGQFSTIVLGTFLASGNVIFYLFSAGKLRTAFLFDVVCWDTGNDLGVVCPT